MKKLLLTGGVMAALFCLLALPQGCWYDNEETLYGSGGCDTTLVRYSVEMKNILEANCYTCHSQGSSSSGFPFDTYDVLKGYADDGKLLERTNSTTNPMPPTGLLPDCERAKIRAWVNSGAPNN